MTGYEFLDRYGTFRMESPENTGYLYFPIAGENGVKGAVTPVLGGDLKVDQNTFVLQPASAEDLMESKITRNFWCCVEGKGCWSVTGASAKAEAQKFTDEQEKSSITAGPMWQQIERTNEALGLTACVTSFVPVSAQNMEVMYVQVVNTGKEQVKMNAVAAVPFYGRSADNLRDHRHVTSLLHRIRTTQDGVFVKPTLSFDERGHQKNEMTYFVTGCTGEGKKPVGFCPVLEDFTGEGGSCYAPEAVIRNLPFEEGNKEYAGYEAIGALKFEEVCLQPGEEASYIIRIGVTDRDTQAAFAHKGGMSEAEAAAEKTAGTAAETVTKAAAGCPESFLLPIKNAKEAEEALARTKEYWLDTINVSYETGDKDFDNFMFWVNFQPMLRRIYGCSFLPHHDYGKGGRGWRDLWQDCLALLIMNPDGVRQMLIDNFGGVRMDGSNATIIGTKQGEFIADRNNITRVWMDHGFWPLHTTKFYIDQTGDLCILLKENTYFKDRQEMRGTAVDESFSKEERPVLKDMQGNTAGGTVLEHLLVQNLTAFFETGAHNHMRLRGADWNDALDMAAQNGESVAFTAAYAQNLDTLAELIEALEEKKGMKLLEVAREMEILFVRDPEVFENSERKREILNIYCRSCYPVISGQKTYLGVKGVTDCLRSMAAWIREHIRKTEWIADGDCGWFNSYYDNHSRQVEGVFENGVRMMLTGQVFTVMSGTASKDQVADIVKAADKYLYSEKAGGYRLNTDFGEVKTDLGRMFGFAYGHKENGAVFSHMTTMFGNALYQRGFVKEGYRAIHSLYEQAVNFPVSRIYPGIPEYFNDRGRGMYNYLTGAASWMMMTVITRMFGARGSFGDLVLEPALLKEQFDENGRAGLTMNFGKKRWQILYTNAEHLDAGEYEIGEVYVNGSRRTGGVKNRISLTEIQEMDDAVQTVVVELKKKG